MVATQHPEGGPRPLPRRLLDARLNAARPRKHLALRLDLRGRVAAGGQSARSNGQLPGAVERDVVGCCGVELPFVVAPATETDLASVARVVAPFQAVRARAGHLRCRGYTSSSVFAS